VPRKVSSPNAFQSNLGYFETVLQRGRDSYLAGARLSYADLSLFKIVEGLRYAFPHTMKRRRRKSPA